MAKMVFPAACPACGKADGKFIEFKIEACTPGSDGAPEAQYGFRCMACKTVQPEIQDTAGQTHRWVAGAHVDA